MVEGFQTFLMYFEFSICLPQGPRIYSPSGTVKHVLNDLADSWELIVKNHDSRIFRISSY